MKKLIFTSALMLSLSGCEQPKEVEAAPAENSTLEISPDAAAGAAEAPAVSEVDGSDVETLRALGSCVSPLKLMNKALNRDTTQPESQKEIFRNVNSHQAAVLEIVSYEIIGKYDRSYEDRLVREFESFLRENIAQKNISGTDLSTFIQNCRTEDINNILSENAGRITSEKADLYSELVEANKNI
jgi:hypothetical protein